MERYTVNSVQRILRAIVLCMEWTALTLIFQFLFSHFAPEFQTSIQQSNPLLLNVTGILSWIILTTLLGYNDQEAFINTGFMLRCGVICILLYTVGLYLLMLYVDVFHFSIQVPVFFGLSVLISSFPLRYLYIQVYKYRRYFFRNSNIMIIGNGKSANDLHEFFIKHKAAKLIHIFNGETAGMSETQLLDLARRKLPEIKREVTENRISEIYWNLPLVATDILEEVAEFADNHHISFKITNDFNYLNKEGIVLGSFNKKPIITFRNPPLASFLNRQIKRAFDLVFSILVLLLVFPWMVILIGVFIRLDSRGPVFFIQRRAGRKNETFRCIKFRTMTVSEGDGEFRQATRNDPRLTRVGAFLRRNNLDEFPQFINVFLGNMSVIGPRPHPPKLDQAYVPLIKFYQYRYFIKPGISGWAQIHGYRGETEDPELMKKRVEYDNWYIENWTLWVDIKIVFKTVINMIRGQDNAY